jgi:hypothetical protein
MKKQICHALESNDIETMVPLARTDRKIVSLLIRLSYDKDTLIGQRAIRAVGLIAREVVQDDPEFLRETCRKLLWSLSDESGGIGWSAPEMLGEIVSADPGGFADLIPVIAGLYETRELVFRPGVVYALLKIAESDPALVTPYQKIVIMSLVDEDPLVKALGLQLIASLWNRARQHHDWSDEYQERIRESVKRLMTDKGEAHVYKDSDFDNVQVGELAAEIIKKLV